MIILNLFIGVMMNSLQEMQLEKEEHLRLQMEAKETPLQHELGELITHTNLISKRLEELVKKLPN
jgi:uncharacterized membrane-anchored protein YhcB (DUF1043 family)